jgi:hypothetical protein
MVDPAISFCYSVYDELASTLSVAGHASIALDKEFYVGLAKLWVIAREGHCFVTVLALE